MTDENDSDEILTEDRLRSCERQQAKFGYYTTS